MEILPFSNWELVVIFQGLKLVEDQGIYSKDVERKGNLRRLIQRLNNAKAKEL